MRVSFTKAQAHLELIFVVALFLLALLPIAYVSFSNAHDYFQHARADDIVTSLTTAADTVNSLGPGNKRSVFISIPSGITGAVVKENVISVELAEGNDYVDIIKETRPTLIGGFAVNAGDHRVSVKAINATLVRIGEGLLLFSIAPDCVSVLDLPASIVLLGDEFTPAIEVLQDNLPYPASEVTVVSSTEIQFNALSGLFPPHPNGEPYNISVKKNDTVSNALYFYVYPASNTCGTVPNPLVSAHVYKKSNHQFMQDITSILSTIDGNKKRVNPDKIVHLTFQNTMKKSDFVLTTLRCHADGNLFLLKDDTSIVVGSLPCIKDVWQDYRIHIAQATPASKNWDISSDVAVDYDYISGWKT